MNSNIILRINKNGKNIAKCELYNEDIGIWYSLKKKNIDNIYGDITQTDKGFIDVLDIDLSDWGLKCMIKYLIK